MRTKPNLGVRQWPQMTFRLDPKKKADFQRGALSRGWSLQKAFEQLVEVFNANPSGFDKEPGVIDEIRERLERLEKHEALAKKTR